MKPIFFAMLLLASPAGLAEVLEVTIWTPTAGNAPLTFQYGQEARKIQERLGANVTVAADIRNRMHFVQSFENWTAWAKFGDKLQTDGAWSSFIDKINAEPSAEMEDQYLLNVVSPGGPGKVYQVFVWQPELGRSNDLIQNGLAAEAIHEKAGADVAINVDQLGRMHYVMSFESWEAWGNFQDTPIEDFQKFMAQASQDPTGTLVNVYTAESL